ncbi:MULTISPECIES: hypothetical protein [unclassified Streptomyces]|uniref:hypothetical protein n=1 Tax=unclassified Streptomyces TaxID=2593676 RepID=UPI000DD8FC32|nr:MULTISPECIES: hypothetical protein [unclassified Streptomyces]QZZ32325.1 hypothetical protein A7X85_44485 [Streptomyces sp. ST1015]
MKPQVNVVALVDCIGALSDRTLLNGNLSLVDDGPFHSTGQGTPDLCTVVRPGQVVRWQALAVDLQTPVEIRSITFLGAPGVDDAYRPSHWDEEGEKLDLDIWAGIVPPFMGVGVAHRYRLELQMYEGRNSVMYVDSPALMCV